ncbi:HD domain-containing protein [Meiothermus sp. PNK-Is4]|nr:polynucleotide adenylyltransferase [Meiothermus sp. Pnk-1]RYM36745.1 HD domain-containing protein [Meiothermus sp. PNK-Is4]
MPPVPFPAQGYLVGGAVRDLLLGKRPKDLDFAVPEPEQAARDLAQQLHGNVFPLDEGRGLWRVVAQGQTYDYAPISRGLEVDLLRRDFTLNALAVNEQGLVLGLPIARYDLEHRLLRAVRKANLWEDPLRSLRAVRLSLTAGLRLEPQSEGWIRQHARYLKESGQLPTWERVGEELNQILQHPAAAVGFLRLERVGLLEVYLPELALGSGVEQRGAHHLDVWRHSLEVLAQLILLQPQADLALRWAALLHDVAKPQTRQWNPAKGRYTFYGHDVLGAEQARQILNRLRQPSERASEVARLVSLHMQHPPQGERELRRFLHRRRKALPELIWLQMADMAAILGYRERVGQLAERLQAIQSLAESAPSSKALLDGREVMRLLGLEPGPKVGQAIAALLEAQAIGEVQSRAEAASFLRDAFAEDRG